MIKRVLSIERWRPSLVALIVVPTLVLVTLAQVLLMVTNAVSQEQQQLDLRAQSLRSAMGLVESEITKEQQSAETNARWVAKDSLMALAVASGDRSEVSSTVEPFLNRTGFDLLVVSDLTGREILRYGARPASGDPDGLERRALEGDTWSSAQMNAQGLWTMSAAPVSYGGTLVGTVLIGSYSDASSFQSVAGLENTQVVFYSNGALSLGSSLSEDTPAAVAAFTPGVSSLEVLNLALAKSSCQAGLLPIGSNGYVLIVVSTAAIESVMAVRAFQMIGVAVCLTILIIMASILLSRRITITVRAMVRAAEAMMNGDYDTKVESCGIREVDELGTTVNHLAGRVQEQISEIEHQAFFDALTGLPNRALFVDRVQQAIVRCRRQGKAVAVLFVDLDNFKLINDSLGHQAGDHLLVSVATRLRLSIRPGDTAARMGGDEFTVLLEDISCTDDAINVAERLQAAFQSPFMVGTGENFVSVSIGIATSSIERDDPDDLLRDADLAMYRAKTNGKAHFEVFDPYLNAVVTERLELETDLRRAIERDEFFLLYQPIVSLKNQKTIEVEALVRWNHPRRGVVYPQEFISVAEENGLIVPLGRWVLREACARIRHHQLEYPNLRDLCVSVNLSPRQILDPKLVRIVKETLRETGLPPECLQLEITESVMLRDTEQTIATLAQLKALGVKLAIDDFGTGYSSLAYLKRFPVDTLKIDREFVANLANDPRNVAIVEAVVAFARSMNLVVTGEGIESPEQIALLTRLGCGQGQGYFFSRPLTSENLVRCLSFPWMVESRF